MQLVATVLDHVGLEDAMRVNYVPQHRVFLELYQVWITLNKAAHSFGALIPESSPWTVPTLGFFMSAAWNPLPLNIYLYCLEPAALCSFRANPCSAVSASSQFPGDGRLWARENPESMRDGHPDWGLPQIPTLYVNKHYGLLAVQVSEGFKMTWHHKHFCDPAPGRAAAFLYRVVILVDVLLIYCYITHHPNFVA